MIHGQFRLLLQFATEKENWGMGGTEIKRKEGRKGWQFESFRIKEHAEVCFTLSQQQTNYNS